MKKIIPFLLLLSFCTNKNDKAIFNSVVRLSLGSGLPFKIIHLRKFDPLYAERVAIDYDSTQSDSVFEFRLNLNEPALLEMVDEHNIGAGLLFVHPADSLSMKLYWPRDGELSRKVSHGKYSFDNELKTHVLYDTINKVCEALEKRMFRFSTKQAVSDTVDQIFKRVLAPFLTDTARSASAAFKQNLLRPQLALLKCFFKNKWLSKSSLLTKAAKFEADNLMESPRYRFWNFEFWEHNSFLNYLFETINRGKAADLQTFIRNIETVYHKKDIAFQRIAVSNGLMSFAEHRTSDAVNLQNEALDSICKVYHLDRKKYNYPDYSSANISSVETGLFDKLKVSLSTVETHIPFSRFVSDTGTIYYLDYWASWCGPCVKSLPHTLKLASANIQHLRVLFVNVDNNRRNFTTAAKKYRLPLAQTFNVLPDEQNAVYYKRLNAIEHLPVYQLIFFENGKWHATAASSAEEPSVRTAIAAILQTLKSKK